MANDLGGVWRTVGGRRIFIKDGQDLQTAMKESKKFPNHKKDETEKQDKKEKYEDTYKYGINEDDEDEAYDKYVDMSEESRKNLDEGYHEEISNNYVGNEYSYTLNENLRNDTATSVQDRQLIEAMDKACQTYTSKEDMASTRFVNMDYLRNAYGLDIPQYGDIDRSVIADNMKQFIDTEISSKGYTSVSLNESGNGMFNNLAVKMKINMPEGTKMFVADNLTEYEAILSRNTSMVLKDVNFKESTVAGFEKEYGKILLTYEVVNNGKEK